MTGGDIPARERVLVGIAVVAFVVSSVALFEYASSIPGYSGLSAFALPVLLEGLTLALGSIAVARHDRGDRAGLAGSGFGAGVTLATVINYAHAIPAIVPADMAHAAQALPWILPPLSMTVAYKVVVQERRARRVAAEAEAWRVGERARRQTTRHDTTPKPHTTAKTDTRERVARLAAAHPKATQRQLADLAGVTTRTVQRHLDALKDDRVAAGVSGNGRADG